MFPSSLDDVLYPYLWRIIAIIYIYINNQSNNNRMIKKDREKVGNEKFSISINFLSTVEETDERSLRCLIARRGKIPMGIKNVPGETFLSDLVCLVHTCEKHNPWERLECPSSWKRTEGNNLAISPAKSPERGAH